MTCDSAHVRYLGHDRSERARHHTLIAWLEEKIDEVNGALPPLTSFVVPGGTPLSAHLHVARTVCRRAERDVCSLAAQEPVTPEVIAYLNRLSDLLFVLARAANGDGDETTWVPGASRS